MYTFVVRDEESTVYSAVATVLRSRSDWKEVKNVTLKANLVLAERNKFPFGRLGREPGMTQLVNYYRGSGCLCRKATLVRSLKNYWQREKSAAFEWLPMSFIVYPRQKEEEEDEPSQQQNITQLIKARLKAQNAKQDEREEFRSIHEEMRNHGNGDVWLAKSSAGAKGVGILISSSVDELLEFVDSQSQVHVIQKYIEQPLLLPGERKFDIRCWVLLDHVYNIFLYKDFVLRTASDPYSTCDLSHLTSHLTNHCIQKSHSQNYGKYEEGNELFFDEFNRFLLSHHGVSVEDSLLPQIRHIVKESLTAVKQDISTEGLDYHSFQLYGFDFIVDSELKVWLIEVNGSPASAERLLQDLAQSLVLTTVDSLLPPKEENARQSLFQKL